MSLINSSCSEEYDAMAHEEQKQLSRKGEVFLYVENKKHSKHKDLVFPYFWEIRKRKKWKIKSIVWGSRRTAKVTRYILRVNSLGARGQYIQNENTSKENLNVKVCKRKWKKNNRDTLWRLKVFLDIHLTFCCKRWGNFIES